MAPLLGDEALRPGAEDMDAAHAAAADLLRIRMSTPLFRLGSAAAVQQKVSFPQAAPGVVAMHVDDTAGADADPALRGVLVVLNASPGEQTVSSVGDGWTLHRSRPPARTRWCGGRRRPAARSPFRAGPPRCSCGGDGSSGDRGASALSPVGSFGTEWGTWPAPSRLVRT